MGRAPVERGLGGGVFSYKGRWKDGEGAGRKGLGGGVFSYEGRWKDGEGAGRKGLGGLCRRNVP